MNIYLRYDVEKSLREYSEKNKITITSVVTKALQEYLKSQGISINTNREVQNNNTTESSEATENTTREVPEYKVLCGINALSNGVDIGCKNEGIHTYYAAVIPGDIMLCDEHFKEISHE
jgi:hypothetical protein